MAAAPPAAPKKAVPSRDTATLTAYYWEAYNEIVEPHRINVYLVDKWLPDLGPVGFAIVQALRRRCYHNPKKGETRNEILVDMNTLGAAIGVSDSTVQRELKRNEALKQFVKVAPQYETQGNGKAPKRFMPAFEVAMDEPIHPSDMERYDALRAQKEAERVRAEEERARAVQGSKYRVRKPSSEGATAATGETQRPLTPQPMPPAPLQNSPKIQNEFKGENGQNETENCLESASGPKIQNEFKADGKIHFDAPKTQIDAPKTQIEVDAPYISSSLFSLPDSLHAADGASPVINNDPKGEEEVASGDGEVGDTFDPLMAIWNVVIGVLANTPGIKLPTLETHFKLLRLVSVSPTGDVVLAARNQFQREWVKDRYLNEVKTAFTEAIGQPCLSVQIVIAAK